MVKPKICIVIPYFGCWPEWTEIFFESCRLNCFVNWVILNDAPHLAPNPPQNVQIKPLSLDVFLRGVRSTLGLRLPWNNSYKICDLRPAFGHIFRDIFVGYNYFGWGDLDVIYGDMGKFFSYDMLDHDCISFCDSHLNGHLCLVRNTEQTRYWYRDLPDWKQRMENPEYTHFDELPPSKLPIQFRIYCEESFNTPLSPYICWTDGTFEFPTEWYWRNGVLTNDKDGDREFLYLHFMHWKGGWWPRQCGNAQWENLARLVHLEPGECRKGFCINEYGFFPLAETRRNVS